MAGLTCCQSLSALVTVKKSEPENTLVTPATPNSFSASGERAAASRLTNSMVPLSRTVRPGMNFRVAGLGVASVWINMAFSGVAGSRPARELVLSRWRRQTHGQARKWQQFPSISGIFTWFQRQFSRQRVDIRIAQIPRHDGDR